MGPHEPSLHVTPAAHDVDVQAVHPLLPTPHVWRVVAFVQFVAPDVQAFVQQAPALQAPLVQGVVPDSYTQFWASCAHVASVDPSAQVFPTAVQTGSCLHVHAADPMAPVQLWFVDGHAAGAP
jgi:hypothetical protein